ncbi:MAG: fatty acid desaturase [Pseudomonadales bacterium]|nr:fatty acid desaturase [Pseudomonadales bacterium]
MSSRLAAFKHAEDRWPVFIILSLSVLDFALYFWLDNPYLLGLYFYLMIIPKSQICAWNHHHQHAPTFRQTWLNRLLEFFYALHTGVTTNLWVLHHVYGHHLNYLDQSKDESRWRRKDGSQMGELEYSLLTTLTAYPRGYQVGKKHPTEQRDFLLFTALTFAIVISLVLIKPVAGLLLFVFPMIMGLFMTAWATYEHHAGLNTSDQYEASFNNLNRWYNLFTGNLGYHTAHHYNGGLHWSKLPKVHERIAHKIPPELIRHTWV